MAKEVLQIAEERRQAKSKAEGERYAQVNAEFQRIARRDKAFFKKQCKEIEEKSGMEKPSDLCKKTGDIKRTFYARMGIIKNRNYWDLTETQEVKKRCQEYRVQFSPVTQLCLAHCNPKDCNMSGLPVHHQLLEFAQTHVH